MDDIPRVAVIDCGENLLDDVGCVPLAKVLLLGDALEEFAAIAELSDQEVALMVLEELVEFEDIGVVQLLQNTDLTE